MALIIPESAGTDFHGFDAVVDAFGGGITCFQNDDIQDSPQVISECFCQVFDEIKSVFHGA